VYVALGIHYEMHTCVVVISDLTSCTIFFHFVSNSMSFKKELLIVKCVFYILYNFCLKHFSF